MSLDDFHKRAKEAEDKLRALETQIESLATYSATSSKSDDEKGEYSLVYWPLKNRGNFVRLVFEEAGVPYKDVTDQQEIMKQIRSDRMGKQKLNEGGYYQSMAVPLIKRGDFLLSQSVTCMGYLAEKFGIRPKSKEDQARAQMIAANCSDIMTELYKQREVKKDELFKFLNGRFQIWLDILQKPLTQSKSQKFYFDNKCTQADLAVFNIMDSIEELFGDKSYDTFVTSTHSVLNEYYQQLKERKSLKSFMDRQKGLYHYAPAYGWEATRKILRGQDKALTFKSDEIIPDVVDNEPANLLTMEYSMGKIATFKLSEMGQTMTPTQVQDAPKNLAFNGCDKNKLYTVILTDPDARDRKKHEFREWVHNVRINVPGSDLSSGGDEIIAYVGSGPPPGSGVHRYVWLVYEQSNNGKIDVSKCGQNKLKSGGGQGEGRRSWKARKFVNDNKLGPLVAGTYYNAEYDDFVPKLYAWLQGKGSYK